MENFTPGNLRHFAVVVDGEVATFIAFPKENEMSAAIYNSNPVFVEVPSDELPGLGFIWDGINFSAPGA
jgi:hypothetical protein